MKTIFINIIERLKEFKKTGRLQVTLDWMLLCIAVLLFIQRLVYKAERIQAGQTRSLSDEFFDISLLAGLAVIIILMIIRLWKYYTDKKKDRQSNT